MSKVHSSPTSRLLQSSRLFSLPRPLPLQPEHISSGLYRNSDTATAAHPQYQAIATTPSSLHRGDWGLKRPIPSKKTGASNPAIRVLEQDNRFHITSFASAGDHVQTERKWAQMEIPLMQAAERGGGGKSKYDGRKEGGRGPMSVFEEHLDNTDPSSTSEEQASAVGGMMQSQSRGSENRPKQRWKHRGRYLAAMQSGEFEKYLRESIVSRKGEWEQFLTQKIMDEKRAELSRRDRNIAPTTEDQESSDGQPTISTPTPSELHHYKKRLRDGHAANGLSSPLTALISEFLDLPNIYTSPSTSVGFDPYKALQIAQLSSTDDQAPPTTHPSAGLSHLRTSAVMANHPLQGPLKDKPPVWARVVRPRTQHGKVLEYTAKLGVGGVVADDSVSATSRAPNATVGGGGRDEDRLAHALDPDAKGGNKIWVTPESAYVDHNSRIRLGVTRAGVEAVAVKEGNRKRVAEITAMKGAGRVVGRGEGRVAVLPESMVGRGPGLRLPQNSAATTRQPAQGAGAGAGTGYGGVEGFDAEMRRGQQ